MIDIFSVPDYKTFFLQYIDKNLSGYSKLDEAKLQFRFEKSTSDLYPLGVRCTYRAFAHDIVLLLFDRKYVPMDRLSFTGKNIGHQAVEASIDWQPRDSTTNELLGIFIMLRMPNVPIIPQGLLYLSKASIDNTIKGVKRHFSKSPAIIKTWEDWDSDNCPKSDSISEYLTWKPLIIPLAELFSLSSLFCIAPSEIAPLKSRKRIRDHEPLEKVISTASVQTSSFSKQTPYVWADSREPVIVSNTRSTVDDDLLMERDYSLLTNIALKDLLIKIKSTYAIVTNTSGSKTVLVDLVQKAVAAAKSKIETGAGASKSITPNIGEYETSRDDGEDEMDIDSVSQEFLCDYCGDDYDDAVYENLMGLIGHLNYDT